MPEHELPQLEGAVIQRNHGQGIRIEGDKTIFELKLEESVETFEVDLAAGRLYQSRIVRQSLARVIKPLETEGIDVFACGQDGETQTVVVKEEFIPYTARTGGFKDGFIASSITSMTLLSLLIIKNRKNQKN